MVPDGVTLRLNAPENLRTALDIPAANEKGGFHPTLAQNVENLLRVACAGAIVEGKRDSIAVARSAQDSRPEQLQARDTPDVDIKANQAYYAD
jgi:hypothetical protein